MNCLPAADNTTNLLFCHELSAEPDRIGHVACRNSCQPAAIAVVECDISSPRPVDSPRCSPPRGFSRAHHIYVVVFVPMALVEFGFGALMACFGARQSQSSKTSAWNVAFGQASTPPTGTTGCHHLGSCTFQVESGQAIPVNLVPRRGGPIVPKPSAVAHVVPRDPEQAPPPLSLLPPHPLGVHICLVVMLLRRRLAVFNGSSRLSVAACSSKRPCLCSQRAAISATGVRTVEPVQ
jgi:hypothetical protein